jgi:hypothetical protein
MVEPPTHCELTPPARGCFADVVFAAEIVGHWRDTPLTPPTMPQPQTPPPPPPKLCDYASSGEEEEAPIYAPRKDIARCEEEEEEEEEELPAYPSLQPNPEVAELAFGDEVSPALVRTPCGLCCFPVGSPGPLHAGDQCRSGGAHGYS